MRAMRLFLGFSAATAFVGAIAAGCGSSSSPSNPVDSGAGDVTTEAMPQMEAAVETGPDVMEAMSDVCVPDADITKLMVPDASIGDAGATAAGCFSCIETACPTVIAQCNQSCACVAAFEAFDTCLANGGGLLNCVGSNFVNVPGINPQSFICAAGCATPSICGYTIPVPTDGGDAATESSTGEGGGEAGGD